MILTMIKRRVIWYRRKLIAVIVVLSDGLIEPTKQVQTALVGTHSLVLSGSPSAVVGQLLPMHTIATLPKVVELVGLTQSSHKVHFVIQRDAGVTLSHWPLRLIAHLNPGVTSISRGPDIIQLGTPVVSATKDKHNF